MPEKATATSPRIGDLTRRLQREPASRVFFDLAREHHAAGNLEDAARVCREGLARHPTYHSARVLLGRVLLELGDFANARPELETIVKLAPDNLMARRLLAEALAGAQDRRGAIAALRSLLLLQPGDAETEKRLTELEDDLESRESAGLETLPGSQPRSGGEAPPPPMAEEIVDTGASPEPHQLQSESTLMMAPLHAPDRVGEEPLDADREMTAIMPPGSVYPGPEDSSGAATVMMSSPVLAMDPASMAEATPLADPAPFLPLEVRETEAEEPTIAIPPEPFRAPRTPVETARPEPVATVMMPPISFGAAPPAADDGERATHSPALFGEAASAPSRAPAPEDEATLAALSPERSGGTSSPASPARAALPGEDEPTMGALPTPTLAEIYLAQGMPGKALEIYKQVLEGDPQNPEALARVRELSERLQPSGGLTQRKIQVLEGWLERIRRHGHVQDDAGRGGPTSAGV